MHIEDVAKKFCCRVKQYKPLRAVYIAETDKGAMIIKEEERDPDKLLYIHGLKEYLYQKGFETLDRFLLSDVGLPFVIQDNRIFVMEKYIDGREVKFSNPSDREKSAAALALLHQKGKGYTPGIGAAVRNNIGKWENDYIKKIDFLLEQQKYVSSKRRKNAFDKQFLKDIPQMIHMGWRGYDTLKTSNYEKLCQIAEIEKPICHHDYTYHNLIVTNEDTINVIDFDYSCHELPAYDLAAFILRIMKRYKFDIHMAMQLIEHYNRVVPITKDDLMLMLSIFEFPQRFWRISERFYRNKSDWSEKTFHHKYSDMLETADYILNFTENFRKNI